MFQMRASMCGLAHRIAEKGRMQRAERSWENVSGGTLSLLPQGIKKQRRADLECPKMLQSLLTQPNNLPTNEWPAMPAPPRLYAEKLGRNGAIPRFILIINANFSCATYWWMASQTSDI